MILRIVLTAVGLALLGFTVRCLARKSLTDSLSLFWGAISVLFILGGLLLAPLEWNRYVSVRGLILILLGGFVVIWGLYYLSIQLSYLIRKNQELAMQVSLLNQEHEKINQFMTSVTGMDKNRIWRTDTTAEATNQDADAGNGDA